MNIRPLVLSLAVLFLGCGSQLAAADASKAATKPGYQVVVEVTFGEDGLPDDAKVIESDDFSGEQILNRMALKYAEGLKQEPKLKDGKPVKFTARVPVVFPVEDDEGAVANTAPKPSMRTAEKPIFPENLIAKGENGGAILELIIGSYGNVQSVKVLRSSHKEYADSAAAAVKQWIFSPAQKDGRLVESRWRIAVGFSADGKDMDWQWKIAPRPSLGNYLVGRLTVPPAAAVPAPASGSAAPATSGTPAK